MIAIINTALLRATVALTGLRVRLAEERGQDLLEYALLGGLISAALVAAAVVLILNGAIVSMAGEIRDCVDFQAVTICNPGP